MTKIGFSNGILTALSLIVDPQSASNSIIRFNESTVNKWVAGNATSDDSWHLSQGGTLGTNDAVMVLPSKAIVLPAQPKFQVYNNASVANVTGDGTVFNITFNTVDFDVGSGFVNPNYVLPNDGTYLFTCSIVLVGLTNAHLFGQIFLESSNGQRQYGARFNPWATSDNGTVAIEVNGMFRGQAGDQIFLVTQITGGAKVVSIYGNTLNNQPSSFQGILLG